MKNKSKTIIIAIFMILGIFNTVSIGVNSLSTTSTGTTLYVGGTGPGNYTLIQDAIDAANNGDTVFVYSGTYYENIIVDKSITLQGEDKYTTIIDGGGNGDVVNVSADYVNICGFSIQDSGYEKWGIYVCSDYNIIMGNNIKNNCYGGIILKFSLNNNIINNNFRNNDLFIYGDSLDHYIHNITSNTVNGKPLYYYKNQNNVVIDNILVGQLILANCSNFNIKNLNIYNASNSIQLAFSSNNSIYACTFFNNSGCGIALIFSSNNNVRACTVYNSFSGIHLEYSSNNKIIACTIFNNFQGIGMYMLDYSSNTINKCLINNNSYGIVLFSCNNIIVACTISNNSYYGIISISTDNIIYHNNFVNNTENAYDSIHHTNNRWINFSIGEGNYWDDYTGIDDDDDGIGDTSYPISGGANNHDWFPLMEPYSVNSPPNQPYQSDGPTDGLVGINYEYTFTATDPDDDNISYYVDWGDENFSGWTELHPSGESITLSHNWGIEGTYNISVKVKDEYGLESVWSDMLSVEITEPTEPEPKLEVHIDRGLGLLFGKVSAEIINTGDKTANNVNFTLSVEYGFLQKTKDNISINIISLDLDESQTIEIDGLKGFGFITISATAYSDETEPVTDETTGFIIFRFILL